MKRVRKRVDSTPTRHKPNRIKVEWIPVKNDRSVDLAYPFCNLIKKKKRWDFFSLVIISIESLLSKRIIIITFLGLENSSLIIRIGARNFFFHLHLKTFLVHYKYIPAYVIST